MSEEKDIQWFLAIKEKIGKLTVKEIVSDFELDDIINLIELFKESEDNYDD